MQSCRIYLATTVGTMELSTNEFWYNYVHCTLAHPEREPIHDAMEHFMGNQLPVLPAKLREMLEQVVMFYTPRAKPGNVLAARNTRHSKYTPEEIEKQDAEIREKSLLLNQLIMAQPTGPMQ